MPFRLDPALRDTREQSLTALLWLQIVSVFLVGPLLSLGVLPRRALDVALLLVAVASSVAASERARVRLALLAWYGLSAAARTLDEASRPGPVLHVLHTLVGASFLAGITFALARAVVRAEGVTRHHLEGAVAVYLNIALFFTQVYGTVLSVVPGAFTHVTADSRAQPSELLYFSLSTLTTSGFGDIVPVHPVARSLVTLEAVIGQVYIATLLGLLVSAYANRRAVR